MSFTRCVDGLINGDGSSGDIMNILKLAGSGEKWLGNIKSLAKEIVDSVPDLPEIGKEAAESLKEILGEVEETYNNIKDDISNPIELMKSGGETLDKVRGLASKVAWTL
jgi:gas vesicle protein